MLFLYYVIDSISVLAQINQFYLPGYFLPFLQVGLYLSGAMFPLYVHVSIIIVSQIHNKATSGHIILFSFGPLLLLCS